MSVWQTIYLTLTRTFHQWSTWLVCTRTTSSPGGRRMPGGTAWGGFFWRFWTSRPERLYLMWSFWERWQTAGSATWSWVLTVWRCRGDCRGWPEARRQSTPSWTATHRHWARCSGGPWLECIPGRHCSASTLQASVLGRSCKECLDGIGCGRSYARKWLFFCSWKRFCSINTPDLNWIW